jgi:hypothetical protein
MLERMFRFGIFETVGSLDELNHLRNLLEVKFGGPRSLQIGFPKLTIPSSPEHEIHVDPVGLGLASGTALRATGMRSRKARRQIPQILPVSRIRIVDDLSTAH